LRTLTEHIVENDSVNHQLTIEVLDEPGHGGASHNYEITGPNAMKTRIEFQNGPIKEFGVNGLSNEALLFARFVLGWLLW
jgi:hypothetical protein